MDVVDKKLNDLFNGVLSPVSVSIFFADNEYSDLKCLLSRTSAYKKHQELSLYEIPSLLRVLCQKANVLKDQLVEDIYQEESDFLCYVLEWTDHARKIIIFNLKDVETFDQFKFAEILKNKQEDIQEIFQKCYYKFMEEITL